MIYDFRKKDTVRFKRNLTKEQFKKIVEFMDQQNNDYIVTMRKVYFPRIKDEMPPLFTVLDTKKTKKTKTEYLFLADINGRRFSVQSRYFKVLVRPTKHHLTNIFSSI